MKRHRAMSIVGTALAGMSVGLLGLGTPAFASWPEPAIESTLKASTKKTLKKNDKKTTIDISKIKMAPAVKFDGKTINKSLAQSIAGNRTLLEWSNCSMYQKGDGSYTGTAAAGATAVPCVYLVTGNDTNFSEYYVLDQTCTSNSSSCLNGYKVETRIDNTLTTRQSHEKTVELVRKFHQSTTLTLKPKPGEPKTGAQTTELMQHKATTRWWLDLGLGSRGYHYEIRNAAGKLIGDPISAVRSDQSTGTGQASCAQLGDEAQEVVQILAMIAGGSTTLASTLIGGIAGAVLSGTGMGFAAGITVGGTIGVAAGAIVTGLGHGIAFMVGKGVEIACTTMTNNNPGGGGGGGINPGDGPDRPLADEIKVGCMTCTEWKTENISVFHWNGDDNTVTIENRTETVCARMVVNPKGTDANNDGWCD